MPWDSIFSSANLLAMIAWAVLILLPRRPKIMDGLLFGVVGLLSLAYAVLIIGLMSGTLAGGPGNGEPIGFGSIAEVQAMLSSAGGMTIGWIHYLAFDLFVGIWIAKEADRRSISRFIQAPILLATFLAGPLGLTLWFVLYGAWARNK